jgi:hypothetical protein
MSIGGIANRSKVLTKAVTCRSRMGEARPATALSSAP